MEPLRPLVSATVGSNNFEIKGDKVIKTNGCNVNGNGGSATVRMLTADMQPVSKTHPDYTRGGESCIFKVAGDGTGNND